jgi:hypothetical protein
MLCTKPCYEYLPNSLSVFCLGELCQKFKFVNFSSSTPENDNVELVGDHGCLSAVLDLLNEMAEKVDGHEPQAYNLHVALV